MKIKWLGHAAMLITSRDGLKVITDPYTPDALGLQYGPIDVEADIVTVSHDHADHNYVDSVKGKPEVVKGSGVHNALGVTFQGIQTYHDDSAGSERGSNTVFCFTIDDLKLCHLGDLGHALRPEDQSQIGKVDILFIPVGGKFTIDAGTAVQICHKLQPGVVIPMHYRTKRCPDFPVDRAEVFLALMDTVRRPGSSEAEFSYESLPLNTEVVVLEPDR